MYPDNKGNIALKHYAVFKGSYSNLSLISQVGPLGAINNPRLLWPQRTLSYQIMGGFSK